MYDGNGRASNDLVRVLRFQSALRQVLILSQEKAVTEEDLREVALERLVEITDSDGGYLHFFNENGQTIDLAKWSSNVHKVCDVNEAMHYPLEHAGIWADCIRQRKPIFHNDYQGMPEETKQGLPEGHFELLRHMSFPVFENGKIVAVGGVGNKAEPYDQVDLDQAELFMSSLWAILRHKQAQEVLQHYAYEDGLTGLTNRRKFLEILEFEWNRGRRSGLPLSMLFVDIDFFKEYNDHYGHHQGDVLLQEVSMGLQKCHRRAGEVVARWGGDEFVVILPNMTREDAVESAENTRSAINGLNLGHAASKIGDTLTVSVGVASVTPDESDVMRLVDLADGALYQAKTAGRNRVGVL